MATRKKSIKNIPEKDNKRRVSTFTCFECGEKKPSKDFYLNSNNPLGICTICADCCLKLCVDESGEFIVRENFIALMRRLDRPFVQSKYREYCQKFDGYPRKIIGGYVGTFLNRRGNEGLTFANSEFEEAPEIERHYQDEEGNSPTREWEDDYKEDEGDNGWEQTGVKENSEYRQTLDENQSRKKKLQAKWGKFQSLEYLDRCEQLYQDIVDGGYNVMSAMHEVSLKNAVRIQIEHDIAFEKGDYERMKILAPMMKNARDEARLNPKQIKEDFQSSGASVFSEMSKVVNQAKGYTYLDMKYLASPRDDIDVMMIEYINYCRHMMGLPELESSAEIYAFYLKRILEIMKDDYSEEELREMERKMEEWNILELAKNYRRIQDKKHKNKD